MRRWSCLEDWALGQPTTHAPDLAWIRVCVTGRLVSVTSSPVSLVDPNADTCDGERTPGPSLIKRGGIAVTRGGKHPAY